MYLPRRSPQRIANYSPRIVHPPTHNHSNNKQSQFLYYTKNNTPSRMAVSPKRVSSPLNIRNPSPRPSHNIRKAISPAPVMQHQARLGSPSRIGSPARIINQSSQRILTPRKQIIPRQVPISPSRVSIQPSNTYYQMAPQQLSKQIIPSPYQLPMQTKIPKSPPSKQAKIQQRPFIATQQQKVPIPVPVSVPIPIRQPSRPPSIQPQPFKIQIPTVTNIPSAKDIYQKQQSTSVNMSRIYQGGFAQSQIQDVMKNIQQRLNRIQGIGSRSSQYFN